MYYSAAIVKNSGFTPVQSLILESKMQYPDSQCAQPTSIGLSKQQTSVRITHLFTEYLNNHSTDDMLLGRSLSMAAALSRFLVLKAMACGLELTPALQKHLNDDKDDVESCSYFISALLRPLVFLRNERSIPLTKDKLRLYSALESVELLAYGDAYSSPEDKSANGFIPPLQRWLLTLPDYAHERRFNQLSTTREAFQQRVKQFLFALDQFQLEFTTNNLPESLEEAELGYNH